MIEEIKSLAKNDAWEPVSPPREKKIVGCKQVFTVKHKVYRTIKRYKTILVAKQFTQTYQETFIPVTNINTIRILVSYVANLD